MRKLFHLFFCLTLLPLVVGLAACGSGNGNNEQPPRVAVVNGKTVTKAEFAAYLQTGPDRRPEAPADAA